MGATATPDAENATEITEKCAHDTLAVGSKCHECGWDYPAVDLSPRWGGAQSFAEITQFREAEEAERNVVELAFRFREINDNIFADPELDMSAKLDAVRGAIDEMQALIDDPEATKGLFSRIAGGIKNAWTGSGGGTDTASDEAVDYGVSDAGGAFMLKQIGDELWWLGIYSNMFRDRERDILAEKAHAEFAEHCVETGEYPVLRLFHTPGTDIGETKQITTHEGFAIAAGTINPGMEALAHKLEKSGALAMSHGFRYRVVDKSADGVVSQYRTFEISVLPAGAAANSLTGWSLTQEENMEPKAKEWFVELLGESETAALEASLAKARTKAVADGIDFKSMATLLLEDPEPETSPVKVVAVKVEADGTEGAIVEQIAEAFKMFNETLTTIATSVQSNAEAITALQQSDDQKLAAKIMPPNAPPAAGHVASEDKGNIIDGRLADAKDVQRGENATPGTPDHIKPYLQNMNSPLVAPAGAPQS